MNLINTKLRQLQPQMITLIVLAVVTLLTVVSCSTQTPQKTTGIAPEIVVDYIHKIIEADRSIYTEHVVDRLDEQQKIIKTSENWQKEKALPLPAQMLRMSAEKSSQGDTFNYRLISPWNINKAQAPQGKFEQKAMQIILETGLPFKESQIIAGKKYFSALYPDKAVTSACINCHNKHPIHKKNYPDKVFKLGDVMGGIVINLPLNKS